MRVVAGGEAGRQVMEREGVADEMALKVTLLAAITPEQRRLIKQDFDYVKSNQTLEEALNSIINANLNFSGAISSAERIRILADARILLRKTLADTINHMEERIDRGEFSSFESGYAGYFTDGRISAQLDTVAHCVAERTAFSSNRLVEGVTRKRWVTAFKNSRDSHIAADGQIVPIDDQFLVGEEFCLFPGERSLSLKNRINCNCVAEY